MATSSIEWPGNVGAGAEISVRAFFWKHIEWWWAGVISIGVHVAFISLLQSWRSPHEAWQPPQVDLTHVHWLQISLGSNELVASSRNPDPSKSTASSGSAAQKSTDDLQRNHPSVSHTDALSTPSEPELKRKPEPQLSDLRGAEPPQSAMQEALPWNPPGPSPKTFWGMPILPSAATIELQRAQMFLQQQHVLAQLQQHMQEAQLQYKDQLISGLEALKSPESGECDIRFQEDNQTQVICDAKEKENLVLSTLKKLGQLPMVSGQEVRWKITWHSSSVRSGME